MPAQRRPGMDHEHHSWSPISTRRPLHWPDQARVAVCVLVTLEHREWEPRRQAILRCGGWPVDWQACPLPTTPTPPIVNMDIGLVFFGFWMCCRSMAFLLPWRWTA